jgi:hypothetical protein
VYDREGGRSACHQLVQRETRGGEAHFLCPAIVDQGSSHFLKFDR